MIGPEECAICLRYGQCVYALPGKECEFSLINLRGELIDALFTIEEEHEPVAETFVVFLGDVAKTMQVVIQ